MTERAYQGKKGWVCPVCKQSRGPDGDDPCIRRLPGVLYACCGHGGSGQCEPYIYFENGIRIGFVPNSISYDDGRQPVIFDHEQTVTERE